MGRLRPRPGALELRWPLVTGISLGVKTACCCGPGRWSAEATLGQAERAHSGRCSFQAGQSQLLTAGPSMMGVAYRRHGGSVATTCYLCRALPTPEPWARGRTLGPSSAVGLG